MLGSLASGLGTVQVLEFLFAKRSLLARCKIQVQMVSVRFVCFGPQYRAEYSAGALVHAPQKLAFRGISSIGWAGVVQRACIAASGLVAVGLCLPVTGRLLESGYGYADCYDASEKLSERWRDLDRRWREYEAHGTSYFTRHSNKVVMYLGDEGPRLSAEGDKIQREGRALDSRCARYEAVVTDRDFISFVRSTRRST